MSTKQEENDIYIIPPNFIETGTLFGGTIKIRNAIEAFILLHCPQLMLSHSY